MYGNILIGQSDLIVRQCQDGIGADAKILECKNVNNVKNETLECVESGKSSLSLTNDRSVTSYRSNISDSNEINHSNLVVL